MAEGRLNFEVLICLLHPDFIGRWSLHVAACYAKKCASVLLKLFLPLPHRIDAIMSFFFSYNKRDKKKQTFVDRIYEWVPSGWRLTTRITKLFCQAMNMKIGIFTITNDFPGLRKSNKYFLYFFSLSNERKTSNKDHAQMAIRIKGIRWLYDL